MGGSDIRLFGADGPRTFMFLYYFSTHSPHPPPAQDLHACNDGCPSHLGDNEEGVEQRAPGGERAGGGLAVILVDMGKK